MVTLLLALYNIMAEINEPHYKKSAYAKTKTQINAFVFATKIVQFFYFLNPKFPAPAISSACKAQFVSDLFKNHIVGFPKRRLIY